MHRSVLRLAKKLRLVSDDSRAEIAVLPENTCPAIPQTAPERPLPASW
jgi:hypothetical protein